MLEDLQSGGVRERRWVRVRREALEEVNHVVPVWLGLSVWVVRS